MNSFDGCSILPPFLLTSAPARNMDESWRMRMEMNNVPRRRSTEEISSGRTRRTNFFGLEVSADSSETLKPEDFLDVFGGPPRSLLLRHSSGDLTADANRWSASSESFYEKVLRSPESLAPAPRSGKNLPVFKIPSARRGGGGGGVGVGGMRRSDGFYDDIFGSDDDRSLRSRSKSAKSKSKSNSSSVLSSEELSPLRPPIAEDVGISSFTSKLRPINVPCRRNSSSVTPEEQQKRHGISANPRTLASYLDFQFTETISDESFRSTYFGFSRQVPSPETETISLEPISDRKNKMSIDTVEDTDSPCSAISSFCKEPEAKPTVQDRELHDQEEDEVMSSYVIEIISDKMEETNGTVDEAIAWAKEKFLTQSSEGLESGNQRNREQNAENKEEFAERRIKVDQRMDPAERIQFLTALEGPKKWSMGEENQQLE